MADFHSQLPTPTLSVRHAPLAAAVSNTSLKWSRDGELTRQDLDQILSLLTQADPVAEALLGCGDEGSSLNA
jgi:hypothetical protein